MGSPFPFCPNQPTCVGEKNNEPDCHFRLI